MGVETSAQSRLNALVNHYTVDQGLPNNIVNCSLKTKDGFEWFGTWYGLTRFDGFTFRTLSGPFILASDPSPRKIETMVEDANGNLWMKTMDWKLSVLFKEQARFKDVFDELKPYSRNLQVIKIQADGYGHVLLLTKDKNLLLASTERNGKVSIRLLVNSRTFINRYNFRLSHPVVQIRNGRASYVGTDYQIYSVETKDKQNYGLSDWQAYFKQKADRAYTFIDKTHCEWKVTGDSSLEYYNPKTGQRKSFQFAFERKITEPSFCDTGSNGIYYLTPAGEAIHIDPVTLQADNIGTLPEMADAHQDTRYFSMRMNSDGTLWLTSTSSGVYRFSFLPRQFRLITLPIQDSDGIRGMYQFANGNVWVGSRNKNLYVLSPDGKMKHTFDYARYGIGSVYHIMVDHKGRIWLSTKGDGLVLATRDNTSAGGFRFTHFRHKATDLSTLSGNDVYMTYEDRQHRVWVGTLDGGLNLMSEQGGKISFYHKYHGMQQYPGFGLYMEVRNMVEDNHGRIWVGTIDGLMSFPSHFVQPSQIAFETYKKSNVSSLANSDIYALHKDRDGQIWVCAFGGGLNRIVGYDAINHRPQFRELAFNRNMRGKVISTLQEDGTGTLWMGNDHGVLSYHRNGQIATFDSYDGFPDVETEEASSLYNCNGEIWMGCRKGILAFQPAQLKSSDTSSPVYIVGATVNNQGVYSFKRPIINKSIVYADTLILHHDQSMFTLEFAAPGCRNQSHVVYRYLLEGYDADWHYSSTNRIASYTHVPPGDYSFIVEASSASNPAIASSRKVTIIILPPWWATWWARAIYALLIVIILYFAVRYARYQLKLKNDIYIQSRIAAFKKSFYMEQQDLQFLEHAKKVVEQNLTNADFDIDLFAEQMRMSHSAFFKRIKQLTGSSPSDYIKEFKLTHALELLKSTSLSVGDVAYKSGFSDAGYFGKCFRKKYGMSPREFQRSQNEGK
ncbi:MAG: helix-turn-helix domain-containing protein [Prevotella sp.]|nr:helix-turn-helix domain-containing protein [Prevotella sp.]